MADAALRSDDPAGVDDHPAVRAAGELAGEVLVPRAEEVDVEGVPASHVEALAAAGLLGVLGPVDEGGADVDLPVARRVTEILSGACGATWFVWTQHASPLRALARSANAGLRERWLGALCREALGGVAVAHLRRSGGLTVRARPAGGAGGGGGGWVLDGTAVWVTSWGLAEVLLVGAVTPDDQVVLALVPARAVPGVRPSAPLALAAMEATRTVRLDFDGYALGSDDVVDVVGLAEWRRADAEKTANVTPAVFGLISTVVARLEETSRRRDEPGGVALARALAAEAAEVRAGAYRLLDEVPGGEAVDERLALRAHALELGVRASTALVAAAGGAGMARSSPAQRLAREALFHLIQAQTAPVRRATLARLGAVAP